MDVIFFRKKCAEKMVIKIFSELSNTDFSFQNAPFHQFVFSYFILLIMQRFVIIYIEKTRKKKLVKEIF